MKTQLIGDDGKLVGCEITSAFGDSVTFCGDSCTRNCESLPASRTQYLSDFEKSRQKKDSSLDQMVNRIRSRGITRLRSGSRIPIR